MRLRNSWLRGASPAASPAGPSGSRPLGSTTWSVMASNVAATSATWSGVRPVAGTIRGGDAPGEEHHLVLVGRGAEFEVGCGEGDGHGSHLRTRDHDRRVSGKAIAA